MASSVTVTEQDRYTVAGLLRHLARQQANDEMLVQGAERRTWAEEFDVACRVAQAAKREGLGVGDRIAFLDRNGIAYFDFLFGGSLIGAVNVAVNWRLAPPEMAAIIDDSGAPVLAVHAEYLPALAAMTSDLPAVRRIVVIGDAGAVCSDARAVSFDAWIEGAFGRGSWPRRGTRRGEHAALHIRDDRSAQGGDVDQRQPRDSHFRSRHHLPHQPTTP